MQKQLFRSIIILVSLLLVGCSSDDPIPEVTTGDLVGTVTLYDKFEKELANKAGVVVEVIIGDSKVASTTNARGEFYFRDIAFGKLTINFKKDNYRGFDSLSYNHTSPTDSLNFIKLAELPPAESFLIGPYYENEHIHIPFFTEYHSDDWYSASHWVFFSKSSKVSSSNFIKKLNIGNFGGKTGSTNSFTTVLIPLKLFRDSGLVSGDIVYLRLYPGNSMFIPYNKPEDGYTNHLFPTYGNNPSSIVWFVMP